jgi:hypothetical protein
MEFVMAKLIPEEKALRRRLRDALRAIELLADEADLVYMDEEDGPIDIDDVRGRLVFEVYNNRDDDEEQPTYITSDMTDEQIDQSI